MTGSMACRALCIAAQCYVSNARRHALNNLANSRALMDLGYKDVRNLGGFKG